MDTGVVLRAQLDSSIDAATATAFSFRLAGPEGTQIAGNVSIG